MASQCATLSNPGQRHIPWARALLAVGTVTLAFSVATAQARAGGLLDEVRIGAMAHNAEPRGPERGTDINVEVLLASPVDRTGDMLHDAFLVFRPHLGASLNLEGLTDKFYAGLTWDIPLGSVVFLESSFGGVLHTGSLDDESAGAYGCRLNFHESGSIGFHLDEHWSLLATVQHMSNANLCPENRGLTSAGVRLGYKLD